MSSVILIRLFSLLLYLAFGYIIIIGQGIPASLWYTVLELFGLFLVLWSTMYLKLRIFTFSSKGKNIITKGPYTLIRHPMYLGLLIIAISIVLDRLDKKMIIAYIIMFIAILEVISMEEIYLMTFKTYYDYCKKTKKLIPFIY